MEVIVVSGTPGTGKTTIAKRIAKEKSYKYVDVNRLIEEYKLIESEVKKINKTENKLSIEVIFKGRKDKFLLELKQIFKGSGIRENAYQEIVDKYQDFIEIRRDTKPLEQILNENQIVDFKRRFTEYQSQLQTYQVENQFIIKYNDKPLKDHSLGQRASALILL